MSRPFWGGLLTLLAGLEIFGTTQMGGDGLRLQMGPTGFLSWLIPTILIASGLLMWITPQHRLFYAVVAVMTAVFSLVAVNLGGFFIGLLLGLLGGALGFAWTPAPAAPSAVPGAPADQTSPPTAASRDDPHPTTAPYDLDQSVVPGFTEPTGRDEPAAGPEPPTGSDPTTGFEPATGSDSPGGPTPVRRADPPGGTFLALLVLACLAASGLATVGPAVPAQAVPGWAVPAQAAAGQPAPCPSVSPTRSAQPTVGASDRSPSAPSTSATPSMSTTPSMSATPPASADIAESGEGAGDDRGNIVTDIIDGIRDLLGGDGEPAADYTPDPTAVPTTSADPGPTADPTPGQPAPGQPAPDQPAPGRTAKPVRSGACPTGPTPGEPLVPQLAPEPDQPMVNREPSRLTGSRVTMYGLRLDGIVDLPTVDGPLRTLRFSMRRAVTDDFDLRIPGPAGRTLDIRSSALTVDGDVRFYATSFTGRILGITLTLTPDSPLPPDGIPLTVPRITFDDPQMRLVFVECDELTAPDLVEAFV